MLDPKKRYQIVNETEREKERKQAHRKDQIKKKQLTKEHKKHLMCELDRKRREQLELEQEESGNSN